MINTIDSIVDSILVDTGTTLNDKIDVIDGIVDAILVDTGTTLEGKIDTIDGIVDAILVDTGTTLDNAIGVTSDRVASILTDTGTTLDTIVDAILVDTTALTSASFADGKSLAQAIQIIAAAVSGRVSGAGTGTETFLGMDEATTRITITVDSDGNRSDISYG